MESKMADSLQRRLLGDLGGMKSLKAQSNGMMDFEVARNLRNYTVIFKGIEGLKGNNADAMTKATEFMLTIALHSDYPNAKPIVTFNEPIFHPNCYSGGRLCTDWNASMKLRNLTIDIARIINYDLVNPASPANSNASNWYVRNKGIIRRIIRKTDFPPNPEDVITFYQEDGLVFL